MLPFTRFGVLALAAFISTSRGVPVDDPDSGDESCNWTLLGYRTVSKVEAASMNAQMSLVYNPSFTGKGQLGEGKSLSGQAGQWNVVQGGWFCYVIMPTTEFQDLGKLWIPEAQWDRPEASIEQYVTSQNKDAATTLRFAQVYGKSFNELFVPNSLVQQADDYQIVAQCYETIDELNAGMVSTGLAKPADVDYTTSTFAGPKPAS